MGGDRLNNVFKKKKKKKVHPEVEGPNQPAGFLGKGLWMGLISWPSWFFLGLACVGPGAEEAAGCEGCSSPAAIVEVMSAEVKAGSGLKEAGPSPSVTSSLFDSGVNLTALGCSILGSCCRESSLEIRHALYWKIYH